MKFTGIIPARYASSRFPGKPLTTIDGKSMIERVYQQAKQSKKLGQVVVATDDERIENCVKAFGGEVIMTSLHHESGTDRCAEVAGVLNCRAEDVIVNIQGDEPYINPLHIDELASCFESEQDQLATLVSGIKSEHDIVNPNVVKVVLNKNREALYFSRAAIPHNRSFELFAWLKQGEYYRHIGIYGYRVGVLAEITKLPKSFLETTESLEQLRWLENGYKIKTRLITAGTYTAIDSPADIELLERQLREGI